jgi:uncharacterized damage-inducible protein DinB
MVRLQTVLESWQTIRADTAAAVEEFPAAELDFRPVAELMTFGEIARHIHDAGDGLAGLLLAGVDDWQTPRFRELVKEQTAPLPENPGSAGLAAALRQSLDKRCAQLAAQSPEFYALILTRFDGQRVTRLEMLQFLKEHELTHRSQLFLYMRLKGLVPPTTRRRQAKK